MSDTGTVICPYCLEVVEVYVDPETVGELVQDCDVCCNPWRLLVARSARGELSLRAERAQ